LNSSVCLSQLTHFSCIWKSYGRELL